jgi:hypothetical protein
MEHFFDEFSRRLAAGASRRDWLLLILETASLGFLSACNAPNPCPSGVVCGSGCCNSTQVCCGSGYCCPEAEAVCCGTGCCAVGTQCSSGSCVPLDPAVREARPPSPAIPLSPQS